MVVGAASGSAAELLRGRSGRARAAPGGSVESSSSCTPGGSTICGFERSGCPGSGPASGWPSPRCSPRLDAGLPLWARSRAAAGLEPSSSGSGLKMPGWFGPRYELQRLNVLWSSGVFGGSLRQLRAVRRDGERRAQDVRGVVQHVDAERLPEEVVPDRLQAREAALVGDGGGIRRRRRAWPSRAGRSRSRALRSSIVWRNWRSGLANGGRPRGERAQLGRAPAGPR